MRNVTWLLPCLFLLACQPEHAVNPVKTVSTQDAGEDATVIRPDASINDAIHLDSTLSDTRNQDANRLDAGTLPDSNQNDIDELPDVSVLDSAETDAWINPYCQPQGEALGSLQIGSMNSWAPGQIILPYEENVLVAVYRFIASGESFTICRLVFELCSTAHLGSDGLCDAPVDEQARYESMTDEVKLVYLDENEQRRQAFAPVQGNRIVFDGLELMVNTDFYALPKLYINAGSVGDEVYSGDTLRVNLLNTAGEIMAVGRNTLGLYPLPSERSYIEMESMVFRKTKPTFVQTLTEANNGPPAAHKLLQFQAIAPAYGGLDLNGFLFAMDSTTSNGWNTCSNLAQGAKWALLDSANTDSMLSEAGDWSFFNQDGHACNGNQRVSYAFVSLPMGTDDSVSVPVNSSRELAVRVDLTGAQTGDSITLEWLDETKADNISLLHDDFDAVNWSDGLDHDIDGRYLQTLPMSSTFTIE